MIDCALGVVKQVSLWNHGLLTVLFSRDNFPPSKPEKCDTQLGEDEVWTQLGEEALSKVTFVESTQNVFGPGRNICLSQPPKCYFD